KVIGARLTAATPAVRAAPERSPRQHAPRRPHVVGSDRLQRPRDHRPRVRAARDIGQSKSARSERRDRVPWPLHIGSAEPVVMSWECAALQNAGGLGPTSWIRRADVAAWPTSITGDNAAPMLMAVAIAGRHRRGERSERVRDL